MNGSKLAGLTLVGIYICDTVWNKTELGNV